MLKLFSDPFVDKLHINISDPEGIFHLSVSDINSNIL